VKSTSIKMDLLSREEGEGTLYVKMRECAVENVELPREMLTWRREQAIRNDDPCISCATHSIRIDKDRN
jgi:hypothetical protein